MKRIKYVLIAFLMFLGIDRIYAGDASISANKTNVTVGGTVAITVKTNKLWGTYSIYTTNGSVLSGGDQGDISSDSFSKTFYFKANAVGTAYVIFGPNAKNMLADPGTSEFFNDTRSIKINVVNKSTNPPVDINKTYSKNNYLKSLGIEGYELNPGFNKDTLEYSVTLSPGTEKIKVTGALEDSKASVKGLGEINVTEGVNTINVVVTAENGNERTYKLVVSVEEKDPINITINNKKYRVIKKREVLGSKNGYDSVDIKINDIGIPVLYNEVTGVTLVGLKDENGTISLFSYDSSTGEYSEYKEFTFDLMNLYVHENKNSKYEKITIKLNGEDTIAYKIPSLDDYYLIYGTNTTTGYEGYYLYDKKENSIQRYDTKLLDKLTGEKNKYLNVVLVLSSVCFLTMLFLLIEVNRDNKREKEIEE